MHMLEKQHLEEKKNIVSDKNGGLEHNKSLAL